LFDAELLVKLQPLAVNVLPEYNLTAPPLVAELLVKLQPLAVNVLPEFNLTAPP